MTNDGPGRPKTLPGKLTNFNTKLQEPHKKQLEALAQIGPYTSYRDMLENWTNDYLKANPATAEKVKAYMEFMGE